MRLAVTWEDRICQTDCVGSPRPSSKEEARTVTFLAFFVPVAVLEYPHAPKLTEKLERRFSGLDPSTMQCHLILGSLVPPCVEDWPQLGSL